MKLAKRLMMRQQGGGGWTPAQITTMWWPDASHASSSGASLYDRSGNGRHAVQATPASQPVKNGSYLTFDGVDDFMVAPAFPISQATSLFLVARVHTVSGDRTIINQQYGDVRKPWQHYVASNGRLCEWRSGGYASTIVANTWFQLTEIQSATNRVDLWKDGNLGSYGTGLLEFAADTSIYIGRAQTYGLLGWLDGDFCEAVLVAGDVGVDLRQRIQGYLAHKWHAILGATTLVSALPADHPYKTSAP